MARPVQIPSRQRQPVKKGAQPNSEIAQLFQQGLFLHQNGQLADAKLMYEQVLAKQSKHFDAQHLLGVLAAQMNNPALAEQLIAKAIEINPNSAPAYSNRGLALQELKRLDDALVCYDKAIAIKPNDAEALNNRGNVLAKLKRLDDALASYDKAIAFNPAYADPFSNRGNVLKELNRLDDALESYDKSIAIKPDYADAYFNRGIALKELERLDDALVSYNKAIGIKPDYAEALNNRGIAQQELKRLTDALESYGQAIALNPDYADAYFNRGTTLKELERPDDALVSFEKAISIRPDHQFLYARLHTQMSVCVWNDLSDQLVQVESAFTHGLLVAPPFPLFGLTDKPAIQLLASKLYAKDKYSGSGALGDVKKRPFDGKIRIGYYSADFHNHATSYLMAELFEAHDLQRFELYGFSFGPDQQDEMRQRVSDGFQHFFDVTNKSDREVAVMSRELGVDIAIDLKGFTQNSRTGIFAERCAPIQVSYLGYPGTMGAPYFDYIVADKTVIPPESQQHFSEKIVYLPHSYQVNDSKRKISDKVFTRAELGLPENGFVFCCFNSNYKIVPATFDSWMRLLSTVDGSVLWLLEDNQTAAKNLRQEAEIRGVNPSRLVFAKRMALEDHLARQRVADLFLDTLPCNAHTTASDALWAGLPVLTLMGQSFAARVAASLLNAIDLPELITETQAQYEARAIELANEPAKLAEVKQKLLSNRKTSPLFNGELFASHIEAAYSEMQNRYICGEQADYIYVAA
jgi:predicted O-linked N-acetylglucosamine transferase (SPINDLY family)